MADGGEPVIHVIKKKSGGHGHHGGAWKVAYADFVTAMMAFFLVMWILGLSKPTRKAIASFFRGEPGFMQTVKSSPIGEGAEINIKAMNAPIMPQDGGMKVDVEMGIKALLEGVKDSIEKDIAKVPELANLKESIQLEMTSEGLRIQLIERTSSLFFDSGSAQTKPNAVKLLQTIAGELKRVKNPIVIEGHTDSRPLGARGGYSNWELSADRANSARRIMEEGGLRSGQVSSVRGFADRRLKKPDDPYHYTNRRVSILVAFSGKEK